MRLDTSLLSQKLVKIKQTVLRVLCRILLFLRPTGYPRGWKYLDNKMPPPLYYCIGVGANRVIIGRTGEE
jgi:hypothetical protein